MCSDNIGSRQPPKSGTTAVAARRSATKQATSVQACAGTSSKNVARKGASAKARTENASSPDGWLRRAARSVSTAASPSDGVSPHRGGNAEGEAHKGVSEPILHRMLCIMQGMEADIVSLKTDISALKTSNKQQAKELAELRAKNIRLELDNEVFREEVESTLEVVEDVATRNFKKGQELETLVKGCMDVVIDEFTCFTLLTDALTTTVESLRDVASTASQGVKQAELHQAIKAVNKKMSKTHDRMAKKHHQMVEAFEALASEPEAPFLPASPLAPKRAESETTTASVIMRAGPNILEQDEDSQDSTTTTTPSLSASSSTSATFAFSASDGEGPIDCSDAHYHKVGGSEGKDGFATPALVKLLPAAGLSNPLARIDQK